MPKIYVICGPSGSGKTTILNYLLKQNIPKLISSTSRSPRANEIDGIDYHFINKSDFNKHDFVEFTEYAGDYYGLSKREVYQKMNLHHQVCCVLEQKGAKALKQQFQDDVVTIGIKLDKEVAKERMAKRGDTSENITKRLLNYDIENEGDIWKKSDCWIDGNQSIEDVCQSIMDIVTDEKECPNLVEHKVTISPITADPIAVFFKERKEEAALFDKQEQQVIDTWKKIIESPNFKALTFKNRINQQVRLHPSSRENIDWQLTFFCKNGEPVMHENYIANNDFKHLGYSLENLYRDLARYSLDNHIVQVTVYEENEPLFKKIKTSQFISEQLNREVVPTYENNNSFIK